MRRQGPDFKPKVNKKYLHMFAWMDKEAESKGKLKSEKTNCVRILWGMTVMQDERMSVPAFTTE